MSESQPLAAPPAEPEDDSRPSRKRRLVVWALIILAALVTLISALTIWIKEQVLDTDAWVATSSELLADEQIRSALSTRIANDLITGERLEAALNEALPGQGAALAGPATVALRRVGTEVIDQLLGTQAVQALWREANRIAHEQLVDVLEGRQGKLITTEGGEVVLDLSPILDQVGSTLGFTSDLPPDAGMIVIMQSDELGAAQTAVRLVKVWSAFAAIAILLLIVLAVYLARGWRREALRDVGAAVLIVGLLLLIFRRALGNAIVDSLASDQAQPAAKATWIIATSLLADVAAGIVVYGALMLVAAWVAGPTRPAVWLRRTLAPSLRDRAVVVYGVAALAFLLVLLFAPTGQDRRLWGVLLIGVLLVVGIEILRRQTAREFPDARAETIALPGWFRRGSTGGEDS